ncbi:hypothetical protein LguiA_018046 [Lonicera macranthoides]
MACINPLQRVDEDDEEFDWEAAVHEIDVACENTNKSSASSFPIDHSHKKLGTSRQSTLDKFMRTTSVRTENQSGRDRNSYKEEGDEGASCVKIDPEAAKTWIYPANYSHRDYQFNISQAALFSNTLVVLPTGLGKTLIAAVVMYNYFRWFPEGKIVFAAPSRPLVTQQIKACHEIVGIPQEWTIEMTGQISPLRRADLWKAKRVFFLTPQVLEKDIQSGTCAVKQLVCLVIDEAHRASGNYAYCVAVRELMAVPVQLRILALSATPGSKQQEIQQIIDTLQISMLEYRNESDDDVKQYVQKKTIDLFTVPMDPDAVVINNLLFEVIRPFASRLCAYGVLPRRDFQTLSPFELINSRDSFRQAPPQDLAQMKFGEVEGHFTVLVTLCHIRKLLSSHGIRPAFDMLEDKLQEKGPFLRFMSKNEVFFKVKVLMQQSLSSGVPGSKLSKMLEVLLDHFKTKDPQDSRVIIFSGFRASIRDILNALVHIGDIVKATEFIGQSSAKAFKGQSQKVQQAVLEKFQAGEYNVIVSTSIGEEGLDIIEVDLVICFDANVSPLRMIQRMGRTGRKSKGRFKGLLCYEGPELNGYKQKQKKGNSVKRHMRNGGISSFDFHSSPRMIPHIYKPEVRVVELSIEQYVPHGKKVRDDQPIHTPVSLAKLTDTENNLIEKYFHSTQYNTWRPSLIAFPHFQAFPSRVHKVMHSFRTGILIDAMQHLQESSFSMDRKALSVEDEAASDLCLLGVDTVELHDSSGKDMQVSHDSPVKDSARRVSESDILPMETSKDKETHCMHDIQGQNPPTHSYLFGSDFVSVDALGRVLVVSVPLLPLIKFSRSKCTHDSSTEYKEKNVPVEDVSATRTISNETEQNGVERTLQAPVSNGNISNGGDKIGEPLDDAENRTPLLVADESNDDLRDVELSPRLTNFIKSGIVPESPIGNAGILEGKETGDLTVPDSPKLHADLLLMSPIPNEKTLKEINRSGKDVPSSCINHGIPTPVQNAGNSSPRRCISSFQIVEDIETPPAKLSNDNCSKDWRISSGEKSQSVEKERKFKRLRKYGDPQKKPPKGKEEINVGPANLARFSVSTVPVADEGGRGVKKLVEDVKSFIDEEAEVSPHMMVSDDEEDEQDPSSYDDSFIDDRINPTAASTQADATTRTDMMAIYRRSLLTQSPMDTLPSFSTDGTPSDSVGPKTRTNESGSSSANHSLQTPQNGLESASRIASESMPSTSNRDPIANESSRIIDTRKRKLSFYQVECIPVQNLEQRFSLHSESTSKNPSEKIEASVDVFDDDGFYASIDLDAVEEEATKLLRHKSQLSMDNKTVIPNEITQNRCVLDAPSFDLGI